MDVITSSILYISLFGGLYYQVFLLVTFFEVDEKEPEKIPDADLPTVSITVPCFNEGKTLGRTVQSLLDINYPADKLSILIVDDGSTDDTYAVAQTFANERVRVIHQKNSGKYTALNLGIASSKAQFVGCLDADSTVHPDALRKMLAYFKTDNVMSVTPALHVYKPSNILQLMQRVEYNVGIFAKRIFGKMNAIHVTPGPFSIFRRSVFEKIGLFKHAHNTEDMEIAFRIQMHGYRIENCPTAEVYTITPRTVKKLYRQRTRWIYGFIQNSIDYRRLFLNKKYGNIGTFTLPFAAAGIVTTVALFFIGIYHLITLISEKIREISLIGFHFHMPTLSWFFINTELVAILAVLVLVIGIVIMLLGRKAAEGTMKPSLDMAYFIVGYTVIAPLWLSKAVFNTVLSRKTPWR